MAGERKSVTELDRTVEYTYDSLYRLTSETITEGEKVTVYTYAYDNVSNRILKTENGAATEYVYNALNQLVSDSETTYEYDLNGNLIRVIGSAQSALYEYNAENKLVKATVQNGSLVIEESYTYDYQGNRTSKSTHKSNGEYEYTKYLNDNSSLTNVLAEIDENGTAKCVYTIGADLISQERDGRTSFYLYDGHGSVVGLANESGVVTDTYAYDAFGNLLKSTGSTKNCYRYCGEQFDETTGLYYLRARYMDTSTGRFISQDSYAGSISDPVSLHKYLYANANPVTYSDPSGNISLLAETIISVGIDVAFYGISSGLINVGLSLIRELRGAEPGQTIDFGSVILTSFTEGFITGAFFGACGMLAESLGSAAIYCALGGSSILFALMSFGAAYAEGKAGNADLAIIYLIFGIGASACAKACFGNAAACVSASTTAKTVTDATTENTNTVLEDSHQMPKPQNSHSNNGKRMNENQQALRELAKEAVQRGKKGNPISKHEAEILDEWAVEYGVPQHHQAYDGSGEHWPGGGGSDHTHIYNLHVPYKK